MKTPRFWYPRKYKYAAAMVAFALTPLSWFFELGTWLRALAARPYRGRVPVLCVGNAVAGGAGKTPTCLALAALLREQGQKPVFITRGYGGHGELAWVDTAHHLAEDVGDEALLLAAQAPTWAGRDRVAAAKQAESYGTVIIMDDGLQNPHIAKTVSVLVVDGEVGIGNGHILPAGPLRENWDEALSRAAALVIIGDEDRQNLAARAPIPVFRARLQPQMPKGFSNSGWFVAFAGIARPAKFYATAREIGIEIAATVDFADHHLFTEADIQALRLLAEEKGARLLTTEKDAVRLPPDFRAQCVILPVTLAFDPPAAGRELARLCIAACAL